MVPLALALIVCVGVVKSVMSFTNVWPAAVKSHAPPLVFQSVFTNTEELSREVVSPPHHPQIMNVLTDGFPYIRRKASSRIVGAWLADKLDCWPNSVNEMGSPSTARSCIASVMVDGL